MATISSLSAPGVEVREYDESLRILNNTGTTVYVPGFAAQGPIEEVINISSITEFESIYGIPTNAAERYFYYTCLAILNNSGQGTTLLTSRLPYGAGEGDNVANAYTLLAYPAIPIAKNPNNDKGYDYWSANTSNDTATNKVKKFLTLGIAETSNNTPTFSPTSYDIEVIFREEAKVSSSSPVLINSISFECGSIPGLITTGPIEEANKATITMSINNKTATSICDMHSETSLDSSSITVYISGQIKMGEDMLGTILITATYNSSSAILTAINGKTTDLVFNSSTSISLICNKAYTEIKDVDLSGYSSSADKTYEDVTYIVGAPVTYNVSLSEYYTIIAGDFFKWSNEIPTFDSQGSFGGNIKEELGKCAFITINTSRATINDSYEGLYLGMSDNLFNEPSSEYNLSAIKSIKFTEWNRNKLAEGAVNKGITDTKEEELNKFISINPNRLDFNLDSSNKGSASSIVQTTTTQFDTSSTEYDDTINFAIFKLSKSAVGSETMKLTYSIVEKYNASLGKTRTYSTSDTMTPQSYFIESIVESSKNMTVMVNPHISSRIKIDVNGKLRGKVRFLSSKLYENYYRCEKSYLGTEISQLTKNSPDISKAWKLSKNSIKNWAALVNQIAVPLSTIKFLIDNNTDYTTFNSCESLYPFATYTIPKKNNKFIGSVPAKITRALDLVSNDEEYPDIDIILEGGLGTIYAYSNAGKNVISEGLPTLIFDEEDDDANTMDIEQSANKNTFNEDAILQGIEDLRTSRTTLTDEAEAVIQDYTAVQEAFLSLANSFQNGGRGDTFYIADVLRGILIRGRDTKVERLYGTELTNNVYSNNTRVNHSWATSIYNPIKHLINSVTSSYASIYAQWLKVLDKFTNEKLWVPTSGYMGALMCVADQLQGPWYAGAGLNRGIVNGVVDCALNPNQKQRGDLYKICVNSVPKLTNVGVTNWGIRTLSKKASAFDQNTCRRTFLFIEKAVKKLLRYYIFEPNNSYTQLSIYNEIEPYMESIRNQGGIYSYQVVCNSSNNTPEIVNAGNLAVDISAAPTRTAEFIVLNMTANKYTQDVATTEFNT